MVHTRYAQQAARKVEGGMYPEWELWAAPKEMEQTVLSREGHRVHHGDVAFGGPQKGVNAITEHLALCEHLGAALGGSWCKRWWSGRLSHHFTCIAHVQVD